MTNSSNINPTGNIGSQEITMPEEGIIQDQAAIPSEVDQLVEDSPTTFRKATLSKREILEELSRERFPWDE